MLQNLTITPATVVILALLGVCVAFAVMRLVKRGMCDCDCKQDKTCEKASSCSECPCCCASSLSEFHIEK